MLFFFLCAFAASATLTLLTVRWQRAKRIAAAAAFDRSGPQNFHARPVPRIGGVGIVGGLLVTVLALWRWSDLEVAWLVGALLLCGAPAFAAGLLEDLTRRVRPAWRLLATACSAAMAVLLLDATIARTDLWGLDWVAAFPLGAAFLAVFAVAGIANAVNIIDGFNGLAAMCVVMMLLSMAYVAGQVGDSTIETVALVGTAAVLGFFVWNYPAGLVFLGDGGAYFIGFFVAELGILLLHRNPAVSPLFPLLMVIYPVFETLFTMYRRGVVRGRAIGMPDGVHLHSLVYRRLLRWAVGKQDAAALTRRNSMTAPYLWLLCMLAVAPSVLFWDNSRVLGAFIVAFALSYTVLYTSIVRFKAPRWLVSRR
jgi:UDP-N-acetylmuramyl pentapeptide phosphotransferase/UDP-N-acetylglucosamine-1-phosphate transferase